MPFLQLFPLPGKLGRVEPADEGLRLLLGHGRRLLHLLHLPPRRHQHWQVGRFHVLWFFNCRFFAVTSPILYSQHRHSHTPAYVTISLCWAASLAIGSLSLWLWSLWRSKFPSLSSNSFAISLSRTPHHVWLELPPSTERRGKHLDRFVSGFVCGFLQFGRLGFLPFLHQQFFSFRFQHFPQFHSDTRWAGA